LRAVLILVAWTLVTATGATSATAERYAVYQPLLLPPQGVGCYWYRGVQYCSRYCYWEIDGYRYCQRRARDAVSQAPYPLILLPPPSDVSGKKAIRRNGRPLK
jgi:hypothetical protein